MLFSEVYGTYYNVLAQLLGKAVEGELTQETMLRIVLEMGFEESILTIPEALENQTWPLITTDYSTPLEHKPTIPLTTLQKRWLKALLNDPRIRLFDPPMDGLEDVEPLYPPDTFVYFDRYNDGDPFDDPEYIQHFRCILSAIRHKRWLRIQFIGRSGKSHFWRCIPYKLEYSAKDDKFRLISANSRRLPAQRFRLVSKAQQPTIRWAVMHLFRTNVAGRLHSRLPAQRFRLSFTKNQRASLGTLVFLR